MSIYRGVAFRYILFIDRYNLASHATIGIASQALSCTIFPLTLELAYNWVDL